MNSKYQEHYLLKLPEVADLLRVSQITVKRLAKRGLLQRIYINTRGDHRFLRSDVENLMRARGL